MADEDSDAREQALRFAAGLQGLALVRTGDTYALAEIKMRGATLDEIAAYLDGDQVADAGASQDDVSPDRRRADLRALLKAERAMIAELEARRRKVDEPGQPGEPSDDRATTEAALAEIRRRITELSEARERAAPARDP
jgi:hypothetical protein